MYVVSVLGFAGLHMTSASSPFEVGPYLIMATGFVVAYHLSGRNLAMTITLHMINNFISFYSDYYEYHLGLRVRGRVIEIQK